MSRKKKYHVRNWREYNRNLEKRGSIFFWIDDEVLNGWYLLKKDKANSKRGRPKKYADNVIRSLVIIGIVNDKTLRESVGFLESIFSYKGIKIEVPDYSTVSRRKGKLEIELRKRYKKGARVHLVVDSSGLKIYGEGEWKVRMHGWSKHRRWTKLHLAVDESSKLIEAAELTTNEYTDGEVVPDLLAQAKVAIGQFSGDKGYDKFKVYEALEKIGVKKITIDPQEGARIGLHANGRYPPPARDKNLREIKKKGLKKWKKDNGYHRRSLAENAFFRFKTMLGDCLRSRKIENQKVEALLMCSCLNKMTLAGMPESYLVTN